MKKPDIYGTLLEICLHEARKSPCQKRGFGAILWNNGTIIGVDHNRFIRGLEFVCESGCIRNNIPSGTESMIGSCGHAEERLIWDAVNEGIDIKGAVIYVAGVDSFGNPLIRNEPYFYCIRCATTMLYSGIGGVNVYSDGEWHFLSSEEAAKSSMEFALKIRKA